MQAPKYGTLSPLLFAILSSLFSTVPVTAETSEGTGTLSVAGQTFDFPVETCNRTSMGDISNFILGGTAQTAEGMMALIQVTVAEKPGKTEHAVAVIKMDGQLLAHAIKLEGEDWKNGQGEPAEPIVKLDGKRVTARGQFIKASYPPEEVGLGVLEAQCATLVSTQSQ